MISTGNDIVALKAINIARTKQPQFYRKILSAEEKDSCDQNFVDELPFENFLWLSWSVKESVYKFLQRITPELVFSPTRVNITHLEIPVSPVINFESKMQQCGFDEGSSYKGLVVFQNQTLYFRTIITEDLICSVVNNIDDFSNTCWGIQRIDSDKQSHQSEAVRVFLSDKLKHLFPAADLQIGKSDHGYPLLIKNGSEISVPISFAHHGYFVAYSIQIN